MEEVECIHTVLPQKMVYRQDMIWRQIHRGIPLVIAQYSPGPSPLVGTRTHIQLRSSTSSPGMQSQPTIVVAVAVVDTAGERINLAKIDLEKSTDYHKNMVKSPDL